MSSHFRPLIASALVALGVVGCADAPDPPEQAIVADRDVTGIGAELDRVYQTFSQAYVDADVQLLMDSVYGEDAYYLPPDSPILAGQDQFRGQFSFLERYHRAGGPGPEIDFEIVDRQVSGTLAYDIGIYTLRPADALEGGTSRGKFLVVWKRDEQGRWRIQADAFSPLD